jgi:hypothetical protein
LMTAAEPEWPEREDDHNQPAATPEKEKLTVRSKAILVLGLLVFALGVYLVGGNLERQDLRPQMAEQEKALSDRDNRIKSLESQLAELRQNNQGTTKQIEQLKAKLDQSEKDRAAAPRRLATVNKEIDRSSTGRVARGPRPAVRTSDPPVSSPASSRSSVGTEPRTYETLRSTPVYEEPANSSRVVAQITKGTQIAVVGSSGGWLEVRSKHGQPPGFIRADDAMFVSKAN